MQTHVTAAKAAVDALSNSVAIEQGPRGITSNVIAPGPIADTEGMERLAQKEGLEKMMKKVPLGRWGRVKEIADATVYLFSDAANFVNGEILVGEFTAVSCPMKRRNSRLLLRLWALTNFARSRRRFLAYKPVESTIS